MKPFLGLLKLVLTVQLLIQTGYVNGIYDFYEKLSNGNDKYDFLKLETPIHFYSDKYDHIYINTNGILTFGLPFANFTNSPFPLEIPAIAPFYANIDTSSKNPSSAIIYYKTKDEDKLFQETASIRTSFYDAIDFEAVELIGVKWENVGHFKENDEKLNTFEVIIVCGAEETYIKYVYPQNGLNWVRGDTGDSGLPDIRAQAGFVSEDGRHFLLKGSGTDKVQYLTENTNYDELGSWLFRVGPLGYDDDVAQPDEKRISDAEPMSCANGGSHKCHINAECKDSSRGFCCSCRKNFIGNGYNCIKSDAPLRITGTVTGKIGNEAISSQLQSYVVLTDGRSYTALSPVTSSLGAKMQFLQAIGGTIGWLFSKPTDSINKNGYQITGGKFNHSIQLRFETTGESFYINQKYTGLNLWDQLGAEIELSGDLPDIPFGARLQMNDFKEDYIYSKVNQITVVSRHHARIGSQENEIVFSVYQDITFDSCPHTDEPVEVNSLAGTVKTSKITLSYESRENALRIGMLSKVGATDKLNPCYDGTSNCGDNTLCVPTDEDSYECNCKNGYTYVSYETSGREHCDDIDECRGVNICDANAQCVNEPGGYTCTCNPGYEGNGYICSLPEQTTYEADNTYPTYETRASHSSYPTNTPTQSPYSYPDRDLDYSAPESTEESQTYASNPCDLCSPYAYCERETCVCHSGYHGSGYNCKPQCDRGYEWDGDACKFISAAEEYEIQPFCSKHGCECSTGYRLIEFAYGQTCRLIDPDSDAMDDDSVTCDIANNCNPFANCEYSDEANKYVCVCEAGYDGDGYDCTEKEISCADEDICDKHASCLYSESARKSICVCDNGYEGEGKYCQLAPECLSDDDCGHNSACDDGICVCQSGYEHDTSDFCVLAGSCGGAYCAENAVCKWDARQKVSYCNCPEGLVGDGIKSCKSLPPPCNVRNNCGLYASCAPNYRDTTTYECVCNPGFFGDGFVCTPEKNCATVPELCDSNANCLSTTAGYECVCNQSFIGNGSTCTAAPRLDSGFLFISQGVATVRIPFDGPGGRPIAMAQMAIGLDKDCSEGRIYWSDISTKTIQSSKYDGSDKKIFISEDIASPEGLAVDWISRRLYWTDSSKDTIEVASLDDPKLRTTVINKYLVNPRGIAVDPHRNKLFWSDWNRESPKIEWANLDGTERQVLVAHPSVQLPNSLDISMQTGELCYADAGTHKIDCIDTYSKKIHNIASNLSYPFGLAISTDRFFWTDWTTKKIESVDFEGNRQKSIPTPLFGSHKMYGMTAITDRCPVFHSPCRYDNGHCAAGTICLTSPRNQSGKVCKCTTDCDNIINLD